MNTLETLEQALKQAAASTPKKQQLSDAQYSAGFDILVRDSGWLTYQDFVIPQLSQLLTPLANSDNISVLEIGPGPKSVLGYLPSYLREKVKRYTVFEPNDLFATRLTEWIGSESPLPRLERLPNIHRTHFILEENINSGTNGYGKCSERYDIILLCHSMYGMKPKCGFIDQALKMLVEPPQQGMVVVFHRDGVLHLDASFPAGVVRVADDDESLDCFAPFIAGYVMQDVSADKAIRGEWRKLCRNLGSREEAHPDHLLFSALDVMLAFAQNATRLPELTAQVPLVQGERTVKNREARIFRPTAIFRPTEVRHIQQCVQWALKHEVGLTVLGGGHSGHCLRSNVVSVDMCAFSQVHNLSAGWDGRDSGSLAVVEAGCNTRDIVRETMSAGMTVPLGSRPSVGAGLYLQGGIGHLARLHGLACDAIVGAVVVSVDSGQVLYVGCVPSQYRPAGAIRAKNESDLLWALKGAGTNFGIVVSVSFKTYPARTYLTRNWVFSPNNNLEAQLRLSKFDEIAKKLPLDCSADAYLYWDADQLHLGVTMIDSSATSTPMPEPVSDDLGPENNSKVVDGVGLFETEMYMSGMHGGHGGCKTSSFKRCLFLKDIGKANVAQHLIKAIGTRPSLLCYLHLLQAWDFACVITGIWPRDQDGTWIVQAVVQWVYNVAEDLLPLSSGVYGADLGPDPRDSALAARAFGRNQLRLANLKHSLEPHNGKAVLARTILPTSGSPSFIGYPQKNLTARVVSISDATKREYAAATGADLRLLLWDRAYKEKHRPALTKFFKERERQYPQILEEHFRDVVYGALDVDVLLITGMRDEAPVAKFSPLVPDIRVIEVYVQASEQTQWSRRGNDNTDSNNSRSDITTLEYCPSLIFDNSMTGNEATKSFAKEYLLPFFHENLQQLSNMVPQIPDFPHPGTNFRHVLNITQHANGLALCTALLHTQFTDDWAKVDAVVSCEAGGFLFASPLACQPGVPPLVLIREAGKLPRPTVSVAKPRSYISSVSNNLREEKRIEMGRDVLPKGARVVVVDDVLSTGNTLCAVLQSLTKAGIDTENVRVMVVAEFPLHRGRELLRTHGFGRINVQSLLVFGGA
ncbi:phosphoribosyl transferase domain protein [Talaromyces proteolyticus]|uniref:Phosphoribosyl transferase domain protein n=1 Tax=Talaromyces proteolyticus TaxID=1131652 RepID=A0AAD4L019_9EURO|nr:phosphoribosyl transferase domain protein [Talaromyces proteolyticus]KAH8705063.1 phosphoribosyl transferase domain protein [Talaromyces proteolyticus]